MASSIAECGITAVLLHLGLIYLLDKSQWREENSEQEKSHNGLHVVLNHAQHTVSQDLFPLLGTLLW